MDGPLAPCNLALIATICLVSWMAFRDRGIEERFIFEPERILARKEYYRLVTSAFLHAGWWHLGLNLFSLYSFGNLLELSLGRAHFLLIFFGAVVGGGLLSLYIHRHHDYRAYGASGGVCGVIFAYVLLFPGGSVDMVLFAVPGWLFAIAFMLGSFYGLKTGWGDIGHDAHVGGAVIGLLIAALLYPSRVRGNLPVFLIVLIGALLLLGYLWANPLMLPDVTRSCPQFFDRLFRWRSRQPPSNKPIAQSQRVDAILDKISAEGFQSLTPEEKALLNDASEKFRRRAQSKKPESGLSV